MQSIFRKMNAAGVSFYMAILTASIVQCIDNTPNKTRIVFPHDFIRFSCVKPPTRNEISPSCTWTFITDEANNSWTQEVTECTKITNEDKKGTDEINHVYEGYVQVPESAKAILCKENIENGDIQQPLEIQSVQVANPLSRHMQSRPKIILQRFSEDYGARLGAHEVTDKEIKIDAEEVNSLKLLCIHDTPVSWKNFTESYRRVIDELNNRDKKWLLSMTKNRKLEQSWKVYLKYLLEIEQRSFHHSNPRGVSDQVMYTSTLFIQNVTNMTSRTYECIDADKKFSSRVTLRIENPRVVGPDELQMIEQILAILDANAQGKGQGREPWYTLGSITSIILILFMYYCKQKLNQPQNQTPSKPNCPTEETEMRTRLQQHNPSRSEQQSAEQEGPTSVVAEHP